MIPNNRAFQGCESVEEEGKVYYRSYKIEKQGKVRLKIRVNSIHSKYRQAIAFSLSNDPKFKGSILIDGHRFKPEKKRLNYVLPVALPDEGEIVMDLEITEGYIRLANASDFLDDYPELIEKISAQTGRTREQFRGCSYTSGLSAGILYGNAFWIENLCDNLYRFHCNDHQMDDDFDDMVFELEIEMLSN